MSQLGVLTLALTVAVYAKTAIAPLQETMRTALGLTDNQLALLQGPALAWPSLLVAIPLGLLVDRYSRVRIVFVLAVLMAVGSLLTALASNFTELFVARGVVGLAAFAISPPALSLISDLYPPHQRGRAFMVTTMGAFGGVAAVFAVGGSLAASATSDPQGWQWAMLWLTGPLWCVALASMFLLREPMRTGRVNDTRSTHGSLLEFWGYRTLILPPLIGVVCVEVALGGVTIWAAPSLARRFALATDRVGAIMAVVLPLGGIVGTFVGGFLADVCQRTGGPRRTVTALGVLAAISVPLAFFSEASGVAAASVLLVLLTATLTTAICMGLTLFTVVVPNELRGLCIGVLMGIGTSIAFGVAPVLVAMLSGALGGPPTIGLSLGVVCATASVICAVACVMGRGNVPVRLSQ
jgi:predicted MFS family arabinose efflux permease